MCNTKQNQTDNALSVQSIKLTPTFEVYQGGITLYKSGKSVQVFCDFSPKSDIGILERIATVPEGYLPNEMGFLGYAINQTTGQSIPIFIDAAGVMRTTEILGLTQAVIYYGIGCYICQ